VVSWVDVEVLVEITSLLATRLNEQAGSAGVRFDVTVKLEEKERKSGLVVVLFGLVMRTKPNVVKYEVEGTATLTGKDTLIDQLLKVDPKSNIPFVFHRVYQHVFTAIYVAASLMNTVHPPSDLLFAGKQGAVQPGASGLGQNAQPAGNVTQAEVKPAVR